jgi:hypothetical protein
MPPCSSVVPNRTVSGDALYGPRACWQEFIDWAWRTHNFDSASWRNGFGFEAACNIDEPVSRTLGAFWLLNYSAPNYNADGYDTDCLHWARRYVRDQMRDVRAGCGDGTAFATTFQTWFIVRLHAHVEIYRTFWYSADVVLRAAILLHESRHFGGKPHNANFRPGTVFPAGRPGADSNWQYEGAWMYTALYLWWFWAAGQNTTPALRASARQQGNLIIDNAFTTHPGFNI